MRCVGLPTRGFWSGRGGRLRNPGWPVRNLGSGRTGLPGLRWPRTDTVCCVSLLSLSVVPGRILEG
eukprot:865102-Alexandrium_andersonii.AAC.1